MSEQIIFPVCTTVSIAVIMGELLGGSRLLWEWDCAIAG